MAFRAPNEFSRERILEFGGASMGKSYDYYAIARMAAKTGSDATFFVIDTDVSAGRMLTDPNFNALVDDDGSPVNVVPVDVDGWDELLKAMADVRKAMGPSDWVMIDMLTPTWDWVQRAFTEKVFNTDLSEYFMQARKAMKATDKNAQPFEGWKDWPVINSMYSEVQRFILRCPGHVYCTSEAKALNFDQAQADTKLIFGPYGVVPAGQKRNPHLFQTVINKRQKANNPGVYEGLIVKDRSRPETQHTTIEIKDFAVSYMVRCAKWRI